MTDFRTKINGEHYPISSGGKEYRRTIPDESITSVEQRTAFGTEYVEYKKEYNKLGAEKIFFRKSFDKQPKGMKWIESKFSDEKDFVKALGNNYKSKEEWKEIKQKEKETLDKNIPTINELEKIDGKIRLLESEMKNGKIDSVSDSKQKEYFSLKNERKEVARKMIY